MIALDIDGVLADTRASLALAVMRALGLAPSAYRGGGHDYGDLAAGWPTEHQDAVRAIAREAFREGAHGVYAEAPALPGALEGANWLARRQLLRGYLTSRPERLAAITTQWLQRHGFPHAPLKHARASKARYLGSLRARVLIDDNPTELEQAHQQGYVTIALDQPYNRTLSTPHVRVSDWGALMALLTTLPLDYRVRPRRGF